MKNTTKGVLLLYQLSYLHSEEPRAGLEPATCALKVRSNPTDNYHRLCLNRFILRWQGRKN